jgi:succinate dehydrogenase/fumarate reductase-like Fe-S protein
MQTNSQCRLPDNTVTRLEVSQQGPIVIEPMGNLQVSREPVVDLRPFSARYRHVRPCPISNPTRPTTPYRISTMTTEEVDQFRDTPYCITRASSYSAGPAVQKYPAYLGTLAIGKLFR